MLKAGKDFQFVWKGSALAERKYGLVRVGRARRREEIRAVGRRNEARW